LNKLALQAVAPTKWRRRRRLQKEEYNNGAVFKHNFRVELHAPRTHAAASI
jgi:hypothetical protein